MGDITRRDFVKTSMTTGAAVAGVTGATTGAAEDTTAPGKIKIVAISCSPRKGRTTAASLKVALDAARGVSDKVQTELIELADFTIRGDLAAGVSHNAEEEDDFPKLTPRLADPHVRGLLIGTPVYFGNMSSLCKAFLDRCILLWQNDFALSGKVAGVVAVGGTRNGGQEVTIQSVQVSLFCQEMVLVGNGRPGPRLGATVWSGAPGGVQADDFGMATTKALGRRVAQVALRMAEGG